MPLDATVNFAKSTLSAGYAAGVTSITLIAGGGAKFPAVPFNAVWWNASNFSDPSDDPNVEIVRVTNVAGDVLTIVRGQEGTADSNHNTPGITYKLIEGLTSSQMDIITPAFALTAANMVWAGPASGPAAAPSFRALVAADIPAGGAPGQVQFNTAGHLDGSPGFTVGTGSDGLTGHIGIGTDFAANVGDWDDWLNVNMIDHLGAGVNFSNGSSAINGQPIFVVSLFAGSLGAADAGETNPLYIQIAQFGAGTIASAEAIFIESPFGSVVGDNKAIFVNDQTAGAANWAIQTKAGMVEFGDQVRISANVALPFVMAKNTQAPTAPSAGFAVLRWEAGTVPGTAKLVGYAGTSATPVTIVDNVGAGF